MASPLTLVYIDNLTPDDVKLLELKCSDLGLQLNRSKCEVIFHYHGLSADHHYRESFAVPIQKWHRFWVFRSLLTMHLERPWRQVRESSCGRLRVYGIIQGTTL